MPLTLALVRVLLATATLAAISLPSAPAAAKCMLPGPALSPAAGTVPAKPVLRLLMPGHRASGLPRIVAHLGGKQVPVTVTADNAHGDLRAYRIVVTAGTAGPLVVSLLDDHGATARTWTLQVDPRWRPPTTAAATVDIGHENTRWTCSHQRTRNLRFRGARVAYRVVLADTPADLGADRTTSVIVPADTTEFFRAPIADSEPVHDIDLALGHVSCLGDTLEWSRGQHARIYALWPDGSEQPVTRAPLHLDPP